MKERIKTILLGVSTTAVMLTAQSFGYAQGASELNQALANARAATARYHDIEVALEEGFVPVQPSSCHGDSNGAVGISYVNTPRFVSPEVDELAPEFLNYIPTGDGHLRLVSVAYSNRVMYRDTRPPDTPGYRPGIFPWQQLVIPPYLEEVSGAFTVFGQPGQGPVFFGRWFYLITVHIWVANPLGMFANGNPLLRCPE